MGMLGSDVEDSVSEAISETKERTRDVYTEMGEKHPIEEEIHRLQQEIQELRQEIEADDHEKLDELERRLESLETLDDSKVEKAVKRQEELRDDILDLKKKVDGLEVDHENLPNDYELSDIIEDLEDKTSVLEEALPAIEAAFNDLEDMQEKTLATTDQLDDLRQDLSNTLASDEELSQVEDVVRHVEDSFKAMEKRLTETVIEEKVDRSELEEKIESARNDIVEEADSMVSGKAEAEHLEQLGERIGQLHGELEDQLQDLDSELQRLDSRISDVAIEEKVDRSEFLERVQELRGDALVKLSELHDRVDMLSVEEKVDRSELGDELEKTRDELGIAILDTETRLRQDLAGMSELRGVWETLELFDERHRDVKSEVSQLRGDLYSFSDEMEAVQEHIAGVENRIARAETEEKVDRSELQGEMDALKDEVVNKDVDSVSREEFDELKKDVQEISSLMVQLAKKMSDSN